MTTPKVIAYIASSVNGYLADSQGTEEWVQPESWKRFVTTAQRYGNVVAGSKTYRLLMDAPQLEKVVKVCVSATLAAINRDFFFLSTILSPLLPMPDTRRAIVVSSPRDAIALLHAFPIILVAGGAQTIGSFLESDILDELWVDIEPSLLGGGTNMLPSNLFSVTDRFVKKLHLFSIRQSGDEAILRYKVLHAEEASGT